MLFRDVFRILGYFFLAFSATLIVPLVLAAYYEFVQDPIYHPQPHSTMAFLASIGVCLVLALFFLVFAGRSNWHVFRKEGLAAVVLIWLLAPAVAGLPYVFSGTLTNPFQAYFEATSGLTTTGSSVMQAKKYDSAGLEIPIQRTVKGLHDTVYTFYGTIPPVIDPISNEVIAEGIEAVSKAVLFWRGLTNWLGGGGIVVLFIAILPALAAGGKVLFQTEVPGPNKEALTPRLKETAVKLWYIYIGLTLMQIAVMIWTNPKMELFDAITTTFATVSTGGLSVRNASIGYYENAATDWVVIVFMILGSVNFSLYYAALRGKFYRFYQPEFFLYISLIAISIFLVVWYLIGTPMALLTSQASPQEFSVSEAMRYGTFQIVSAITTTGFSNANFDIWPYLPQALMLLGMYFGGMSGSTSGGIKTVRLIMLFRIAQYKIETLFRPHSVRFLKVEGKEVDRGAAIMVLCFFLMLTAVSVGGILLYIANGVDPETSTSLVACMINNTGMTFRVGGPLDSCAFLSNFGTSLSSLLMILGRLEFFAVFAFLVPSFWKQT